MASKFIPYKYTQDGLIWAIGLRYEEAVELQHKQGGTISPDLDRLPARKAKPIKDLPIHPAAPALVAPSGTSVAPNGAGPVCLPLVAPAPVAISPVAPAGGYSKDEARAMRTAAAFGFSPAVSRMAELSQIHAKARLRGIYQKAVCRG